MRLPELPQPPRILVLVVLVALGTSAGALMGWGTLASPISGSASPWHLAFYTGGSRIYPPYAVSVSETGSVSLLGTAVPEYVVRVRAWSPLPRGPVVAIMDPVDWHNLSSRLDVPSGTDAGTAAWTFPSVGPGGDTAALTFAATEEIPGSVRDAARTANGTALSCADGYVCGFVEGLQYPSLSLYGIRGSLVLLTTNRGASQPGDWVGSGYTDTTGFYAVPVPERDASYRGSVFYRGAFRETPRCVAGVCELGVGVGGIRIAADGVPVTASSGGMNWYPEVYNRTVNVDTVRVYNGAPDYIDAGVGWQLGSLTVEGSVAAPDGGLTYDPSLGLAVSEAPGIVAGQTNYFTRSAAVAFPYQWANLVVGLDGSVTSALERSLGYGVETLPLELPDPWDALTATAALQNGTAHLYTYRDLSNGTIGQLPVDVSQVILPSASGTFNISFGRFGTFRYRVTFPADSGLSWQVFVGVRVRGLPSETQQLLFVSPEGNDLEFHIFVGPIPPWA